MQNAHFLPGSSSPTAALLHDLGEGLRYTWQGQEKVFSWRTTFLELDRLPFVRRTGHDRFGWPVYRFDVPLRLGTLEIGGLQVNVPTPAQLPEWRFDVPLDHLPFEVRLAGDGAENYWQLKTYFQAALGESINGWERDDQLHAEWNSDGLLINITYWFKSNISKQESGFASLVIGNQRIFPEYFTDDYIEHLDLDTPGLVWQTFDLPHSTVPDFYRTSQWVRFTPAAVRKALVASRHALGLWYDPTQGKLGFAKDERFCKIVQLIDIKHFVLQLIDHDRGQYSQEIQARRRDGGVETLLSGQVGALEEIVALIAKVGLQIVREG